MSLPEERARLVVGLSRVCSDASNSDSAVLSRVLVIVDGSEGVRPMRMRRCDRLHRNAWLGQP